MKNLVVLFAIVLISLAASCTQRTCPTYTKEIRDIPQDKQVEVLSEEKV